MDLKTEGRMMNQFRVFLWIDGWENVPDFSVQIQVERGVTPTSLVMAALHLAPERWACSAKVEMLTGSCWSEVYRCASVSLPGYRASF